MKYTVIGLGNFGRVLAGELTAHGHEVIGIDRDMFKVDAIKDRVAAVYRLDAADIEAMKAVPINDSDVVIVSIGENFGDSIKIVSILKILKAKKIYARALDLIHEGVLNALEVDKILKPESESANNLVQSLDAGTGIEAFKLDEQYYIEKFAVPSHYIGLSPDNLKTEEEYGLRLICICRGTKIKSFSGTLTIEYRVIEIPQAGYTSKETAETNNDKYAEYKIPLKEEDLLVCYGNYRNFKKFWESVK
jgi:trk system potassium uptake protein